MKMVQSHKITTYFGLQSIHIQKDSEILGCYIDPSLDLCISYICDTMGGPIEERSVICVYNWGTLPVLQPDQFPRYVGQVVHQNQVLFVFEIMLSELRTTVVRKVGE